ncbi:hypothetical protein RND81_08G066400 [Saponaria officinalis]|uniref:Myb-like domain-containing protein n=1 Tax=Saponaria officinalis TaxID=3572 RepID=A0AAW1J585_SAPOF
MANTNLMRVSEEQDVASGTEQHPTMPVTTSVSNSLMPEISTCEGLDNIDINHQEVDKGNSKRERWTLKEDKALAKAWVVISEDESVGNNKKDGAFWKRIAEYYNKYKKVGSIRAWDKLKSRYYRVLGDLNVFNEIYIRIHNQYLSGWSDDKKRQATREEYHTLMIKKHFTNEHMWDILCKSPKWSSGQIKQISCSKRTSSDVCEQSEVRPPGQQAAKVRKKAKGKVAINTEWNSNRRTNYLKIRTEKNPLSTNGEPGRRYYGCGVADVVFPASYCRPAGGHVLVVVSCSTALFGSTLDLAASWCCWRGAGRCWCCRRGLVSVAVLAGAAWPWRWTVVV